MLKSVGKWDTSRNTLLKLELCSLNAVYALHPLM